MVELKSPVMVLSANSAGMLKEDSLGVSLNTIGLKVLMILYLLIMIFKYKMFTVLIEIYVSSCIQLIPG